MKLELSPRRRNARSEDDRTRASARSVFLYFRKKCRNGREVLNALRRKDYGYNHSPNEGWVKDEGAEDDVSIPFLSLGHGFSGRRSTEGDARKESSRDESSRQLNYAIKHDAPQTELEDAKLHSFSRGVSGTIGEKFDGTKQYYIEGARWKVRMSSDTVVEPCTTRPGAISPRAESFNN